MRLRSAFILMAIVAATFVWGCSSKKTTAPQDRAPILEALGTHYVTVNQVLSIRITASDPDGDSISLSAEGLPAHAMFSDSLNGVGRLIFTPDSSQAGTIHIEFIASDREMADSGSANIVVVLNPMDTLATATTNWNSDGFWETTVNATSSSDYSYYGFAHRDTVTLTSGQAASDTNWNIAFKRSGITLNGGASGPDHVEAIDLASIGNADSTDFAAFTNASSLPGSDWASDSYSLVINEWYLYNSNNHTLTPTRNVYIMKDALGNYVKFQIHEMENPGMPPNMGTITMLYKYSGSSPTFSGPPDTLTFDASSGTVYIDFSAGAVTNPGNPTTSTDWDLEFTNYEIHQNATVFGIGACGTYEVWEDQTDPTNFSETSTAPTAPQAYFADNLGSVMANWYDYDGNTHILTSKNHVYAIRSGGHNYKLQIVTYYKEIGGSPVSAWYTFRWAELQ